MIIQDIPKEHTAAIIRGQDDVVYSGKIKDTTAKWDNLPFSGLSGLFQFALYAIDGKWYRTTWVEIA